MGKGKRLRKRRLAAEGTDRRLGALPVGAAGPAADGVLDLPDYPFLISERTRSELGAAGLAELAANLWPQDCQSCGWELGSAKPSLAVEDMIVFASASLHHERCRPPAWNSELLSFRSGQAAFVSFRTQSFMMPFQRKGPDGIMTDDHRPALLVNPNLESINLNKQPDGSWRVATVQHYRSMGLRTAGKDYVVDRPIPDITASLNNIGDITISFADSPIRWTCSGDIPWREAVRDLGGVMLIVTTAAVPDTPRTHLEIVQMMISEKAVVGWIALDVAEQPLSGNVEVPEIIGTYLVHHGPDETVVGQVLATADPELTPQQAQAWAAAELDEHHDVQIIGPGDSWTRCGDPVGWRALTTGVPMHHIVRRHLDGWKLLAAFAMYPGTNTSDIDDIEAWASAAVRRRGNARILSWVPAATTETPGYTTLQGSGTAR
ncbi:hypothetical protein [Amycolatopsis sp. NPDC058986]|uniref:hypothetical protein n=1 Tax=unclassified Amycolatopsis TaxID=2618356 RepID=UPI00366B0079